MYYVADKRIALPPESNRNMHDERRPFVVVSGSAYNSDAGWPFVLGCPVSSSTRRRTKLCVKIAKGDANATKRGWIRVSALQPLMKGDLGDFMGILPSSTLDLLHARVLQYMGILQEQPE